MTKDRLQSIQVLRAIAAWMVVFHHYNQVVFGWDMSGTIIPESISNFTHIYGKMGVDLFFIISGLIMYVTIEKSPTAIPFLFKRIARIFPPYWFHTIALLLVAINFNYTYFETYTATSIIKSLFLIPHDNPNGIGIFPYLTVGWTLFFEMSFYIICSLAIILARKYWWIFVVFILTISPQYWHFEWGKYFIKNSYISEFAIGIMIGFVISHMSVKRNLTISFSLISFGIFFITSNTADKLTQLNLGIIVLGFCFIPDIKSKIIDRLIFLGNISYSTYLVHVPILVIIYNVFGVKPDRWQLMLSVSTYTATVIALSTLSYKYIEVWFVDKKLKSTINRIIYKYCEQRI